MSNAYVCFLGDSPFVVCNLDRSRPIGFLRAGFFVIVAGQCCVFSCCFGFSTSSYTARARAALLASLFVIFQGILCRGFIM